MFIVGKSFFSETLSKLNIKTIAILCIIHFPYQKLVVAISNHILPYLSVFDKIRQYLGGWGWWWPAGSNKTNANLPSLA